MYYTTLNKLLKLIPRESLLVDLLKHLGKKDTDDEPFPITAILDCSGLSDAIWALRACDCSEKDARLFGVWLARQAQPDEPNEKAIIAIETAEKFADGDATEDELWAAWCDAEDAAISSGSYAAWAAESASSIQSPFDSLDWTAHQSFKAIKEKLLESIHKAQKDEFRRRFG